MRPLRADSSKPNVPLPYPIIALFAVGLYVNLTKVLTESKLPLLTSDMLIIASLASAMAFWFAGPRRFGAIEGLIVAFGVVCTLEVFHPNVPSLLVGLEGYRRLVFQMLGILVGVAAIRSRQDIIVLWKVLAILAVPILLYSIKQFFAISDFDQAIIDSTAADIETWRIFGKIRSFGLFSGPFHLGIFAGIIFWIALALRVETGQRRYTLLATVSVAACIASMTRSSVVALVVSIPVVFFWVLPSHRLKVVVRTLTITFVVGLLLFAAKSSSSTVASLVEGYSLAESLQDDGRFQGRFSDYQQAITQIAANPLGSGMGSASDAMGSHFAATAGNHVTSHNLVLWVAVETGIIGLVLFIVILVLLALSVWNLARRQETPIAMASGGGLVVIMLAGLTGSTLSAYPINLIFWTLSGCYIGYLRLNSGSTR